MASKAKKNPEEEEEEGKIPVLTVLKNKAVLKNIFIVNKPPEQKQHRDHEDILFVGRHPDCDLMLTHPSISRFHLQIRSKPSSLSLSVLDLSSVHGTWVSGRKIEAGVSVEMKEGDTLKIGVSSRVYRLHWIPISRAYDLENPFVQQEQERAQKLNCCPTEMEEIQSLDSILECISSLFVDENVEPTVKQKIPVAYGMADDIVSLCCEEKGKSPSKDETFGVLIEPFGTETSYSPTNFDGENELCDSLNQDLLPPYVESIVKCDSLLTENLSETECLPVEEAVFGTKMQQFQSPQDPFTSPLPLCMQNLFENHCSVLLKNMDPASFDEKSAAEAVISKESESGCTIRDYGRVTGVSTAGAGTFNSENRLFPLEEAIPSTKFQQIKVVEEDSMDLSSDREKQNTCDQRYSLNEIVQDVGNKSTACIFPISLQLESVNSSMPQEDVLDLTKENQTLKPGMEILESNKEAVEKTSEIRNIWLRRGKATTAPQIRSRQSILKSISNVDNEVATINEKNSINKAISKDPLSVLDGEEEEEEEIFTPDKENFSPNALRLRFLKQNGKQEEIKLSKSQRSHNSKDNFDPEVCPDESICPSLSKKSKKDITNNTISKDLFPVLDGEDEGEVFTPDKENFSPNTLQLRLLKKKGKLEEIKRSKSQWSQNIGPNLYLDENISPTSNKENQIPKGAQDQKLKRKPFGSHVKLVQQQDVTALKKRVERVPFQLLKTACAVSAVKSINVGKFGQNMHINPSDINGVQKRSWDMVVDTTSLINKESRKALQLLEGLKGTRLIVPRLVIRELQRMKQQFTVFRRNSEASLALEWIEECLVKTNWWIHIQSSVEEGGQVAPTPPASPQNQLGEESYWTFIGGIGISMEIASPTIEDHILDFALLYKRKQNDGQLVLLSEDVTLKIKCMAEGLLCEPVQEFRESLVNPFSKRFLWINSSPRGQTWSCQDDVVLRDKYCPLPLKKSSKGVMIQNKNEEIDCFRLAIDPKDAAIDFLEQILMGGDEYNRYLNASSRNSCLSKVIGENGRKEVFCFHTFVLYAS